MLCKIILLCSILLQPNNAQEPHSPELEKMEAKCTNKEAAATVQCKEALTCSSFGGSCAAGDSKRPGDTICEGSCTAATCCAPKKCQAQQDLCVDVFIPKKEVEMKWTFAPEKSRVCPREYEKIKSATMCQAAALNVRMQYSGIVNTARFPSGCFHYNCNKNDCSSLMRKTDDQNLHWEHLHGVVFFNEYPDSISNQISLLRHFGTKLLCKSYGRMCLQTGCTTETCCDTNTTRTCGTFFTGGCRAGEERAENSTKCTSCTSQQCCKRQKCINNEALCIDGWKPLTAKPPNGSPTCVSKQPKFALSAKDTSACQAGYEAITTVEDCKKAAQYLKNSQQSVSRLASVKIREIASTDPLGASKPYGCFSDESSSVVSGKHRSVTTLWFNHNTVRSRKHSSTGSMCKLSCDDAAPITYCDSDGCKRETCCKPPTCKTDFHGHCGRGEVKNGTKTCRDGVCTDDTCCEKRLCSSVAPKLCSGDWKLKSSDTRCKSTGCDKNTCCILPSKTCRFSLPPLTPGAPAGKCPPGSKLKSRSKACPDAGCDAPGAVIQCCEPLTCGADFFAKHHHCDIGDIPLPSGTYCRQGNPTDVSCSNITCCRRGGPSDITPVPYTTVSTTGPLPLPPCGEITQAKFVMSARDTTACQAGYEVITTVEECARAVQYLSVNHSGLAGKNITVIPRGNHAGAHKLYGCFSDRRIVNGSQHLVDTLWFNYNNAAVLKHDNSAPICKLTCSNKSQGTSHTLANELYDAGGEGQHLRKHAASGSMDRPFAITSVAFLMLVATFAYVYRKGRGHSARSSYRHMHEAIPHEAILHVHMVADDDTHLKADTIKEEDTLLQLALTTDVENAQGGGHTDDEAQLLPTRP